MHLGNKMKHVKTCECNIKKHLHSNPSQKYVGNSHFKLAQIVFFKVKNEGLHLFSKQEYNETELLLSLQHQKPLNYAISDSSEPMARQ